MLKEFKDDDFENKIKNEDVSVIQFSANWCSPCKTLKPIMDKLSEEFNANFYYADVEDDAINTGSAQGIRGLPTIIIFKKGIEVERKVGGAPEGHMKEFLEKNISSIVKDTQISKTEITPEAPKEEVQATEITPEAPKEEVQATEITPEAPKEEVQATEVSSSETDNK